MRTVSDRQLRKIVSKAFKAGGFRGDSQIRFNEDLVFEGAVIPKSAKIFFPPQGSTRRRSYNRAVIYLGDKDGSTICIYPEGIKKKSSKGIRQSRLGTPGTGVRISSFV